MRWHGYRTPDACPTLHDFFSACIFEGDECEEEKGEFVPNPENETIKEMRPRVSSTAAPKIAMRLAQMQMGDASPVGAASDLAAILAAQAAMVAAITAASSSAAVATTAT